MPEFKLCHCLEEIDGNAWNACFPGELENYAYLQAVANAGIPDFQWRYLTARQGKELLAAMPVFLTDYHLDTTAQGASKFFTNCIKKVVPNALTLKLACLGSPASEWGLIGFHPMIAAIDRAAMLNQMLRFLAKTVAPQGYRFLGIKDIPAQDKAMWDQAAGMLGYRGIPSLPTAYLDIDFNSIDEYLGRLSAGTRKDMRRKLRALDAVRVEHRHNIDDVLPEVMRMYQDTRARSDWQFEELTADYFTGVLQQMGDRALCTLYFADNQLLAANLLLRDDTKLLDKFFCMGLAGKEHNLYFLSWFVNIQYCLDHGLTLYQSGQAAYQNKIRLGSSLIRNTMYFRHLNPVFHTILNLAAPFLAADETETLNLKQAA